MTGLFHNPLCSRPPPTRCSILPAPLSRAALPFTWLLWLIEMNSLPGIVKTGFCLEAKLSFFFFYCVLLGMYRRKLLCFMGVTSNLHKKIHAALWPPTLLRDGEKCFPLLTSIIIKEKSTKSSNNGSSVVFLHCSRWSRGGRWRWGRAGGGHSRVHGITVQHTVYSVAPCA